MSEVGLTYTGVYCPVAPGNSANDVVCEMLCGLLGNSD